MEIEDFYSVLPSPATNRLGIPDTALRRFLSKINVHAETGCWIWMGSKPIGYGQIRMECISPMPALTHVLSYRLAVGDVPKGNHVHHKCCNRACVNPAHLECLTPSRHIDVTPCPSGLNRKKTHCKRGHELTPDNTYAPRSGGRYCKACSQLREAKRLERRKHERAQRPQKPPRTHCSKGHLLTGSKFGCEVCRAEASKRYVANNREVVLKRKAAIRERARLKRQQQFYDQFSL